MTIKLKNKTLNVDSSKDIVVDGNSKIYIINPNSDLDLHIHLLDNSNLEIYDFNETKNDINYLIEQDNNTIFNMYHTFRIKDSYNINYKVKLNGDNNINNVYIHGVSNGVVSMNVDGILTSNHKNNEVNEDIKVLTIHGKCFISPMLHVSALDVIANHNTAISNIDQNELFYLETKGIDSPTAQMLIENGYVYGLFKNNEEFLKLIKGDSNE